MESEGTVNADALVKAFLARFDAYVAASGCKAATLAERLLGRANRLQALRDGALNIGVQTLDQASERLAALEAQQADAAAAEARERPQRVAGSL